MTSPNHCHCQDCVPSVKLLLHVLIDDNGLYIRDLFVALVLSYYYTNIYSNTYRKKGSKAGNVVADTHTSMTVCIVTNLQAIVWGDCVLFQSSKLLGLGSPLCAYHSATLMATQPLKCYSGLLRGAGGGAEETTPWPCSARPGVTLPFFCYTKDFFKCLCDNGL